LSPQFQNAVDNLSANLIVPFTGSWICKNSEPPERPPEFSRIQLRVLEITEGDLDDAIKEQLADHRISIANTRNNAVEQY